MVQVLLIVAARFATAHQLQSQQTIWLLRLLYLGASKIFDAAIALQDKGCDITEIRQRRFTSTINRSSMHLRSTGANGAGDT